MIRGFISILFAIASLMFFNSSIDAKSVLQLIPFQNTVPLKLPKTSQIFTKVNNKQVAPIIDGSIWQSKNNLDPKSLKDKIVFLTITRTWCPACRDEWDDLNELYQSYKTNKSFKMIALVIDDGLLTDPMEEFLNDHPVDFTVVIARTSKKVKDPNLFADLWSVRDFPANYLIDRNGLVQFFNVGGGNTRKYLDQLLGIKRR